MTVASDLDVLERELVLGSAGATAPRTDLSNAEALVDLHRDDLRYVGSWGRGLAWDRRRWAVDDCGAWERAAIKTSRVLFDEAVEGMRAATASGDEAKIKTAKAAFSWAMSSQNDSRLASMIRVARAAREIVIRHEALDADPWLLNVQNGTIDLRLGELHAHRREDLITKLAPVAYDPAAQAPTWTAFLDRVMCGNRELIEYLQRIVGYALTGSVREHVLAFFFGGGANGKSTFLGTIHAMLGDYATPAPRGLLFRARGERHPTELATLHGRRFVTCAEIEEGQAFDEALVKDLTGGDPIECRRMRENFWTYAPTHKLFIAGNHKPTVRGDDEGIWRRMRMVPWLATIPEAERDPELPAKLRAELPGVLAWAVRGCLAWQTNGLGVPDVVRRATGAYRDENDVLGEFFRLSVVFESDATIARKDLRDAYEAHCRENGAEPFGAKRFAARLRERGVSEKSVRVGVRVVNGWKGVRLMTDVERESPPSATNGRRYVGTCSEENGYTRDARARDKTNPESLPTTAYVPTEGQSEFAEYLANEGIGGAE